jgi:hypothetical protein
VQACPRLRQPNHAPRQRPNFVPRSGIDGPLTPPYGRVRARAAVSLRVTARGPPRVLGLPAGGYRLGRWLRMRLWSQRCARLVEAAEPADRRRRGVRGRGSLPDVAVLPIGSLGGRLDQTRGGGPGHAAAPSPSFLVSGVGGVCLAAGTSRSSRLTTAGVRVMVSCRLVEAAPLSAGAWRQRVDGHEPTRRASSRHVQRRRR